MNLSYVSLRLLEWYFSDEIRLCLILLLDCAKNAFSTKKDKNLQNSRFGFEYFFPLFIFYFFLFTLRVFCFAETLN